MCSAFVLLPNHSKLLSFRRVLIVLLLRVTASEDQILLSRESNDVSLEFDRKVEEECSGSGYSGVGRCHGGRGGV